MDQTQMKKNIKLQILISKQTVYNSLVPLYEITFYYSVQIYFYKYNTEGMF